MGEVLIVAMLMAIFGLVFLMVVTCGFIVVDIIRIIIESWREQQ